MPRTARTRRLGQLTAFALGFALLALAVYGRRADTATLKLLGEALRGPAGTDSTYYMRMGEQRFEISGQQLYAKLFLSEHQKFIYPPSSLFLIEALDRLPSVRISPDRAWKIFMLTCWLASIGTGVLLFRQQSGGRATPREMGCIALLGFLFLPFAEAFFRGQVQMLLTALWGVAVLLFARGRRGYAGVLLALTCAFKPQLAVFLLWGVLRRERRFTLALAATAAAIGVASLLRFGLQAHLDYLAVLRTLSRHGEALAANQSFLGALNRLFHNGDALTWSDTAYPPYRAGLYIGSSLLTLLCLAAGLLLPRRAGWSNTTADFVFFGCVSVLLSPIAWEHHYGYFFGAAVLLLAQAERLSSASWLVLCAALLALSNRLPLLDGLVGGVPSLLGDYLLFSGLALLAKQTPRNLREEPTASGEPSRRSRRAECARTQAPAAMEEPSAALV